MADDDVPQDPFSHLKIITLVYDTSQQSLSLDYGNNISEFEALGLLSVALRIQDERCDFIMDEDGEEGEDGEDEDQDILGE